MCVCVAMQVYHVSLTRAFVSSLISPPNTIDALHFTVIQERHSKSTIAIPVCQSISTMLV